MTDYHSIRWIDNNTATRHTKEVNLICKILDGGKRIEFTGTGDFEHHLIEDSAILMSKVASVKCGSGHDLEGGKK